MDIFDFELQKKIMQDEMIIVFCYVLCRDVVHGNTKLYRGCLYGSIIFDFGLIRY